MAADGETTLDAVLDGRLTLRQPKRGHRVGHDAILLAAATEAKPGELAVELGAGVGAAGLALARRVAGLKVTLVELDAVLAALAQDNAARNELAGRVQVAVLDVAAPDAEFANAGIGPGSAACVLMNPPFNDPARQNVSPDPQRRFAHAGPADTLSRWMGRAASLLASSGTLTLIWRADGLDGVLAVARAGFGGVAVLPIYPRPDAAAIRILVRAIKGSRAPLAVMPGLTLNDSRGRPTGEAEAILRGGALLRWRPD
ncbi:MAG: methyltransferase [Alphaproteobacteria bacterium]|nr:MAG: methyltransferase [Alphaproteobacteria bacterium]